MMDNQIVAVVEPLGVDTAQTVLSGGDGTADSALLGSVVAEAALPQTVLSVGDGTADSALLGSAVAEAALPQTDLLGDDTDAGALAAPHVEALPVPVLPQVSDDEAFRLLVLYDAEKSSLLKNRVKSSFNVRGKNVAPSGIRQFATATYFARPTAPTDPALIRHNAIGLELAELEASVLHLKAQLAHSVRVFTIRSFDEFKLLRTLKNDNCWAGDTVHVCSSAPAKEKDKIVKANASSSTSLILAPYPTPNFNAV